jgi:hypothetical protein
MCSAAAAEVLFAERSQVRDTFSGGLQTSGQASGV